jgi:hypothetical protein
VPAEVAMCDADYGRHHDEGVGGGLWGSRCRPLSPHSLVSNEIVLTYESKKQIKCWAVHSAGQADAASRRQLYEAMICIRPPQVPARAESLASKKLLGPTRPDSAIMRNGNIRLPLPSHKFRRASMHRR